MRPHKSTLENILNSWREEAESSNYSKERIKGTAFEELCIAFIANDPVQQGYYDSPMPYSEWASMQGIERSEQDIGIDLVARLRDTQDTPEWCAIQCKFWARGKTLQKKDVDSFLAASSKKYFARRLIIDTTGKPWSKPVEDTLREQQPPVVRIGLHELKQSSIDWDKYVVDRTIQRKRLEKTPYPHQADAINKVLAGLRDPAENCLWRVARARPSPRFALRKISLEQGAGYCISYRVWH